MAGSGDDTLVAGIGDRRALRRLGADVLYGGDLPQQDAARVPDSTGSWSELAANTTNDSETITGLATTSGLTKGQIVRAPASSPEA